MGRLTCGVTPVELSSGHSSITTEKSPSVPALPRSTAIMAPPKAKKLPAMICGFLLPKSSGRKATP